MKKTLLIVLRVMATPLLSILLIASFVVVTPAYVAKGTVLEPGFYAQALAENDVYDRVYSDVLADVALAEQADNLSGGVQTADLAELEALLREALPPAYLQEQVEANIGSLLGYLKGEQSDPALSVELEPVLENIGPAAIAFVSNRLGGAMPHEVSSFEVFAAELDEVVAGLARGEIPGEVPSFVVQGTELRVATTAIIGGYDGDERASIESALARGDTVAALQAALPVVMQPGIDQRVAALRAELGQDAALDLVAQAAEGAGETREEWVAGLGPARRLISNANTWLLPGALAAFVGSALPIGALYLPGRRRALVVMGSAIVVAGFAGLVAWYVHSHLIPPAVSEAARGLEGSNAAAWAPILADVAEWMARESSGRTWHPALVAIIAGTAVTVAGLIGGRSRDERDRDEALEPLEFLPIGPIGEERQDRAA